MHFNDKERSIDFSIQRAYFSFYRSFIPGSIDIKCLRDQRNKEVHRETAAGTTHQQPVLQQVRNGLCMTVTVCRREQGGQTS